MGGAHCKLVYCLSVSRVAGLVLVVFMGGAAGVYPCQMLIISILLSKVAACLVKVSKKAVYPGEMSVLSLAGAIGAGSPCFLRLNLLPKMIGMSCSLVMARYSSMSSTVARPRNGFMYRAMLSPPFLSSSMCDTRDAGAAVFFSNLCQRLIVGQDINRPSWPGRRILLAQLSSKVVGSCFVDIVTGFPNSRK